MNSVLKLLLEGEALDTAQIGRILGCRVVGVAGGADPGEARDLGVHVGDLAVIGPLFKARLPLARRLVGIVRVVEVAPDEDGLAGRLGGR